MRRATLLFGFVCLAWGADWPQWRGPNRDGKSAEKGLLRQWPTSGPKVAWTATGLGEGYSSVTTSQGRVFTLGQQGDTQYVIAIDAATGKKLWQSANGGAYRERRGDGPRGVPTIEGDLLWALSADGTLGCFETKTGRSKWSINLANRFNASVPHWGYSESPLLDGENLIVAPGGTRAGVVALNKKTGAEVWKSQSDGAAYSSAILAQTGKVKQVISFLSSGVVGLRADNGELLWTYKNVANRTANVATPIFANDAVFLSSDYGTGCALLRLTSTGSGVKADEVYFNRDMRNHHASSILLGEHLYGFSSQVLTAMQFQTGQVAWRDRSVGKGSLTYADGLLFLVSEDGVIGLAEANPQQYKEISRFTLNKSDRPTWAPPVISNGHLYVRDQGTLYSFEVAGK
jgi:outer membrane protein assembly factor BamB